MKNNIAIVKEFFREFETTGTICPTSKKAASVLALPVRERGEATNILEIGAGTGPVTREILKAMSKSDTLTVCEINPRLVALLKKSLEKNTDYALHKDRIEFFEGPIQDLPQPGPFDVIVCSLPFLNFDIEVLESIFDKLRSLSSKHTIMTYYEYIGLKKLSASPLASPARRARINEHESFFSSEKGPVTVGVEPVWFHLLPINILRVNFNLDNAS